MTKNQARLVMLCMRVLMMYIYIQLSHQHPDLEKTMGRALFAMEGIDVELDGAEVEFAHHSLVLQKAAKVVWDEIKKEEVEK